MNYQEIKQEMLAKSQPAKQDYTTRILNTKLAVFSLKMADLRVIAKKLKVNPNFDLEQLEYDKYYEMNLLYFMVSLSRLKTYQEQVEFLLANLAKVDTWAITDTVGQELKPHTIQDFSPYFKKFLQGKDTFTRRYAYIGALDLWKQEGSTIFLEYMINDEEYYVMMAEAWLMATLAITHPDAVYAKLTSGDLNRILVLKTISKMCDSYRIPSAIKEKFKLLRKQK